MAVIKKKVTELHARPECDHCTTTAHWVRRSHIGMDTTVDYCCAVHVKNEPDFTASRGGVWKRI